MFWVNRTKTPIQQEIDEFAESRKKYVTTSSQIKHLYDFIKLSGIQSFDDVTPIDIDSYNASIRETMHSEYLQNVAIQAVQLFMKYRKIKLQKENQKKRRGRPAKVKRNENILALRDMKDEDGKPKYSLSMIGKKYHLSKVTVFGIIKRLENKG